VEQISRTPLRHSILMAGLGSNADSTGGMIAGMLNECEIPKYFSPILTAAGHKSPSVH
jgi:hypothetical protein